MQNNNFKKNRETLRVREKFISSEILKTVDDFFITNQFWIQFNYVFDNNIYSVYDRPRFIHLEQVDIWIYYSAWVYNATVFTVLTRKLNHDTVARYIYMDNRKSSHDTVARYIYMDNRKSGLYW